MSEPSRASPAPYRGSDHAPASSARAALARVLSVVQSLLFDRRADASRCMSIQPSPLPWSFCSDSKCKTSSWLATVDVGRASSKERISPRFFRFPQASSPIRTDGKAPNLRPRDFEALGRPSANGRPKQTYQRGSRRLTRSGDGDERARASSRSLLVPLADERSRERSAPRDPGARERSSP